MAKDTCVKCGKPLPANNELASVPNARLVAFDPDANRVWRICGECNHWHLLGPQASRAAIPELQGRYDSEVTAGEGPAAMAVVSDTLLLFRVGAVPTRDAAEVFATEIHAGVGKRLPWQFWAAMVGILLAMMGSFWLLEQSRWTSWIMAIFSSKMYLTVFAAAMLARGLVGGTESYRGLPGVVRWLWVAFVPMLLINAFDESTPLWQRILSIGGGLAIGVWLGRRDQTPRGLRWQPGSDSLSYHDGLVGDAVGWAATSALLFELLRELSLHPPKPADRALAWQLWQEHGSLPALLNNFADRRDSTGLLRLTSLTKAERQALLIAVGARLAEPPAEVIAGLEEAERVAAIAETLDNELTPPAPHAPLPPAPPA